MCDTGQVQTLEIEHVAVFWYDDFGKLDWFLAIVDGPIKDTKVALSYMKNIVFHKKSSWKIQFFNEEGCIIEMHSESRLGWGDIGVNPDRLNRIYELLV